jgi:hypothetical protein
MYDIAIPNYIHFHPVYCDGLDDRQMLSGAVSRWIDQTKFERSQPGTVLRLKRPHLSDTLHFFTTILTFVRMTIGVAGTRMIILCEEKRLGLHLRLSIRGLSKFRATVWLRKSGWCAEPVTMSRSLPDRPLRAPAQSCRTNRWRSRRTNDCVASISLFGFCSHRTAPELRQQDLAAPVPRILRTLRGCLVEDGRLR